MDCGCNLNKPKKTNKMAKINFQKVGMKVAAVSAGFIAGKMADKIGFVGNLNPYMKGGAKLALGGAAVYFGKGKENLISEVGIGIGIAGVMDIFAAVMPSMAGMAGIGDQYDDVRGLGYVEGVGKAYIEEDFTPVSGDYDAKVYGDDDYVHGDSMEGVGAAIV